jgi:mRNA interferase RelE/StbE
MSAWRIEYIPEARDDLRALDNTQRMMVLKAIVKVSGNPLPSIEGGFGKSLGNRASSNLTGYLKIKLKRAGLRVVYKILYESGVMKIIVISVRDDETVYRIASERIK